MADMFFLSFDLLSCVGAASSKRNGRSEGCSIVHLFVFISAGANCDMLYLCAGTEEDDVQVADENHHQHAEPLPLPVCQSPAGMDGVPLQYALLHRFYGTGIHF